MAFFKSSNFTIKIFIFFWKHSLKEWQVYLCSFFVIQLLQSLKQKQVLQ